MHFYTCTNLNSIMGLFRANNTATNFWMLFATLSAYAVVASEVGREDLAHVACEQISLESFCNRGFFAFLSPEVRFRFLDFTGIVKSLTSLSSSSESSSSKNSSRSARLVSLVICLFIWHRK